jgi:hypothetical protein
MVNDHLGDADSGELVTVVRDGDGPSPRGERARDRVGNQGALFGNAMTWWDHDTGSVWMQPTGKAILGPLRGARLELLASTLTDWGSWRRSHPETLALDADGGPTGFDVDRMQIALELGGDSLAVPVGPRPAAGGRPAPGRARSPTDQGREVA